MKRYIRSVTTRDNNSSLPRQDLWDLASTTRSKRILQELATSDSDYVRYCVAYNPHVTEDILEQLADDDDVDVVGMVAIKTESVDLLARLASDTRFPDSEDGHSTPVRGWAAGNVHAPEYLLRKLATDQNPLVRQKVAKNLSTPTDVLEQLVDDTNSDVASAARERLDMRKRFD